MKRTHNLQVRVTPREHDIITSAARAAGYERVSEWVRKVLSGEAAAPRCSSTVQP